MPGKVDDISLTVVKSTVETTITCGMANSDPVDAKMTPKDGGAVTTSIGPGEGENCAIKVTDDVPYLLSSNNNDTPNVKKATSNALPRFNLESTTEETNETYEPTSKPCEGAEATRGAVTDNLSDKKAKTIASVIGPGAEDALGTDSASEKCS